VWSEALGVDLKLWCAYRSDWKNLRIEDDVQGQWTGHFESAGAALAELQKEYD
jgi:hypothetical protein